MSKTATETQRAYELAEHETIHALNSLIPSLVKGMEFDDLADAAETLTRAANRVAPEGHYLRIERV